jgi:signal transduction histidine kinase/ligand-binding sensor domain-containing protein
MMGDRRAAGEQASCSWSHELCAAIACTIAMTLTLQVGLSPTAWALEPNPANVRVSLASETQSLVDSLQQSWRWREIERSRAQTPFLMVTAAGEGELLVADAQALWRHDGLNWNRVGHWGSYVPTVGDLIHPTADGFLASRKGEVVFLGNTDPETFELLLPSGMTGSECRPAVLPDGRLLAAARNELVAVSADGSQPFLSLPDATYFTRALAFDSAGGLWCATNQGILRRDGDTWEHVPVAGDRQGQSKDIARVLVVNDRLVFLPRVFSSSQSGLVWDGEQLSPLSRAHAQGQLSDALLTPEGDILLAIQHAGLLALSLDEQGRDRWRSLNVPAPFDASIRSMTLMPDGRFAAVTQRGHLLLNDHRSQRWSVHDPTDVDVSSIVNALALSPRGGVWIGTHEGIARFDGERFVDVFLAAGDLGLELNQITAIHEDKDGQLWLGSGSGFQGLLRYDGVRWHHEELAGLSDYGVHAMHTAPDGNLWLTMLALSDRPVDYLTGAILERTDAGWKLHNRLDGNLMARMYSLTWQPDGTLLAGSRAGVASFDGRSWTHMVPSPLTGGSAFALAARSNGDLWLGRGLTQSGVSWYEATTDTWHHPEAVPETDIDPSDESATLLRRAACASFAETRDGRLWFASETGLYQVVRGQCHEVSTQGALRAPSLWPMLTSSDGYSLWIGSLGSGLARYTADDHDAPTAHEPRVTVPDPNHTRNVVLSWTGSDAWSVTAPDMLLFRHSLDGAELTPWSSQNSLTLFDAAPGPHELAVLAMDTAGNVQEQPVRFAFDVDPGPPPLWLRPQMLAAYSVALMALGCLAVLSMRRRRERRLEGEARTELNERLRELTRRLMTSQEDERRNISRDLHDDLGQLLTVTTMQIELAEGLEDHEQRHSALQLATRSTRQAMDSVRNLAAQIRPTLLDDLGLETAVNATLDDYAASTGLTLERDVVFEHAELSDNVASHVFRIVKESLTNVVRHAHAEKVSLRLEVTAHAIDFLVQDDGDGFDPEISTDIHGIGLLGMRERAEALGGTFVIETQPGQGTSLHVTIPLDKTSRQENLPPW